MWNPRVGGEKKPDLYYAGLAQGSPPRGQGKADPSLPRIDRIGITPAWAGKSGKLYRRHMGAQDHPRVGGEKSFAASSLRRGLGSPPHGRGKVVEICDVVALVGITPARAGKR